MTKPKPKVVFDTGIFLQATISDKGPAAKALRLFEDEALTLFISNELLEEMRMVLTHTESRIKTARYTDQDIEEFLNRIAQNGILIAPLPSHFHYERDPKDEHIINLAIEAKVQYIISRDRDLLDLMNNAEFQVHYPDLKILDPLAFLKHIDL